MSIAGIKVSKQPKPMFTEEEREFINIARSHPLSWAEYMELNKGGRRPFKSIEQQEKYEKFLTKFDLVSLQLIYITDKKGKDLEYVIVDKLLAGQMLKLTPIGRAILEGRGTPKQKENTGR